MGDTLLLVTSVWAFVLNGCLHDNFGPDPALSKVSSS